MSVSPSVRGELHAGGVRRVGGGGVWPLSGAVWTIHTPRNHPAKCMWGEERGKEESKDGWRERGVMKNRQKWMEG